MRTKCIRRTDVVPSIRLVGVVALLAAVTASSADAQWARTGPSADAPGEPTMRWTLTPKAARETAAMPRSRSERSLIVGAAITSIDVEDIADSDRITSIAALVPRAAVGFGVSDRVAIEVPFSLQSSKSEDEDRFTDIEIGIRPVAAIYGSDAVSGVLTLTARLNRQSFGDESSTRFGWELGAGPEFTLNDALALRATLVYGQNAEDEDVGIPKESYFGLNLDLVHTLNAAGPRRTGGFVIRTGAAFTSVDPEAGDGESLIEVPSPYFGGYFNLSDCDCIRLGGEIELSRVSQGDFSQSDFTIIPTVEYDFLPADPFGLRGRAFGLVSRQAFDSGSFDDSGTITGFGGGVAGVFPLWNRYHGVIGLDYLKASENEDLGSPSANIIRLTFGVELPN